MNPPNGQMVKEYQISGYFVHIFPTRIGGWIGSILGKDRKPIRSLISYSEHSVLFECRLHIEEEVYNETVGKSEIQQPTVENCGDVPQPT